MFLPYLLVLYPAMIHAEISVKIDTLNKGSVHFYGEDIGIITDEERNIFGLDDEFLMEAAQKYYGEKPTNIYVRSPTPGDDLYQKYNWQQVTRTLVPESARILEITESTARVDHSRFYNTRRDGLHVTVSGKLSNSIENSVSSSWTKGTEVEGELSGRFTAGIKKIISFSSKYSIDFTSKWGETKTVTETVVVESAAGFIGEQVGSFKNITADLMATQGIMRVEVNYVSSLSGNLAVNFYNAYKKQHFWALPVEEALKAGGKTNVVTNREVITVQFYTRGKVIITET